MCPATKTRIECAGLSDIGCKRSSNQDRFLISDIADRGDNNGDCRLLVVADGMGGHAAGEAAAEIATHTFRDHVEAAWPDCGAEGLRRLMTAGFNACQEEIESVSRRNHACFGMGTTLTAAIIVENKMTVAHAGDSRCYLLRDGEMRQLTTDHNLAALMEEAGSAEEEHACSHVLWNCLKANRDEAISVDILEIDLKFDDTVILCSDGLTRHISDDNVGLVLGSYGSLHRGCRMLVDMANDSGGSDNITVVVARIGVRGNAALHWGHIQRRNSHIHLPQLYC